MVEGHPQQQPQQQQPQLIGGFKHLDYFPFHIWVVILPIDPIDSYVSRWVGQPPTRQQWGTMLMKNMDPLVPTMKPLPNGSRFLPRPPQTIRSRSLQQNGSHTCLCSDMSHNTWVSNMNGWDGFSD